MYLFIWWWIPMFFSAAMGRSIPRRHLGWGPISSLAANSRRAAAVSWHGPADWAPARTSLKRWSRCGRWKMLEVGCGFRSLGCLRTCWSCRVWWLWWHGMVHWTGRVDWEESCLHMVVEEKLGQRSRITNNMTKELALSQSLRSAVCRPMPGVSCLLKVVLHRVFPHRAKFQAVIWNWNQLIHVYCRLCLAVLEISTISGCFPPRWPDISEVFKKVDPKTPKSANIRISTIKSAECHRNLHQNMFVQTVFVKISHLPQQTNLSAGEDLDFGIPGGTDWGFDPQMLWPWNDYSTKIPINIEHIWTNYIYT